jgi:hypothetical protein
VKIAMENSSTGRESVASYEEIHSGSLHGEILNTTVTIHSKSGTYTNGYQHSESDDELACELSDLSIDSTSKVALSLQYTGAIKRKPVIPAKPIILDRNGNVFRSFHLG